MNLYPVYYFNSIAILVILLTIAIILISVIYHLQKSDLVYLIVIDKRIVKGNNEGKLDS